MNANLPPHPKFQLDRAGSLLLNFGEYGGEIELACFSPCGTRLLTVKKVEVAHIWEVDSGKLVGKICPQSPLQGKLGVGPTTKPFQVFIEAAALDQRGEHALLGLNDGTARVFRTADESQRYLLYEPNIPPATGWGLVRSVAFSPDSTLAVVGFNSQTVGVWRVADGTLHGIYRGPRLNQAHDLNDGPRPGLVCSVGISADNHYLFAGYSDMTGTIWDLHTGEVFLDWSAHTDTILALVVEGQNVWWVTSGGAVWQTINQQTPQQIFTTGERLAEAVFSPDGQTFLARTPASAVKWWTLHGIPTPLVEARDDRQGWPEGTATMGFDATGKRWYFPVAHNCFKLTSLDHSWLLRRHLPTPSNPHQTLPVSIMDRLPERIDGLMFSPDGSAGVTHGWSGHLELWDLKTGQMRFRYRESDGASAMAFSVDGSCLAIGVLGKGGPGPARHIKLLSVTDGNVIAQWPAHTHQIHRLAFGPDGTWLVSTGLDRAVRLWEVERQKLVTELLYEDLEFQNLTVLSDGRILVYRSQGIEVWRALRTKQVTIPIRKSHGQRYQISKDEKVIAVTIGIGISLWSLDNGCLLHQYDPDIPKPKRVPDTILAEELGAQAGALLWEAMGANFIHTGDGPRGWVTPLNLSQNNQQILIPTDFGLALIDLRGEQQVKTLLPFEGRLRSTCVTEEFILAVNSAGKITAANTSGIPFRWNLGGNPQ